MEYHRRVAASHTYNTTTQDLHGIGGWAEYPLSPPSSMDAMAVGLLDSPLSGAYNEPEPRRYRSRIPIMILILSSLGRTE